MGYVGNQQAEGFVQRPTKQDLTGATGTSLTLTHAVSKEEDIDLYINNVKQEPTTAYTVADTAVTLTGSVVATDDIYVVYNSLALQTVVPPDGSVTNAKIDTVAASKLTGTIADARMPAGSVVQTVFAQYSTQTSITSTTAGSGTSTGVEVQITPHSSTNKLLIQADLSIAATAYVPNTSISLEVYDGSSVVYQEVNSTYFHNASGDENYYTRGTVQAFINAHSGAKTYTVRAFKGATGTVVAQPNSNLSSILIQEIKQ